MSAATMLAGRYRLGALLGTGGTAAVYEAEDVELGRRVAVKVVAEHLAHEERVRTRFLREARLAARLSHPNVVRVFDSGEDEGRLFTVMELVDGEPLSTVVRRDGALPPLRAAELVAQAAAGVAAAHDAGLVHRDVKPSNLLVRDDGVVKVADFGIARADDSTQLTLTGAVVGTAAYLAPEQALGQEATPASDVYALGAVLYELLTAERPRRGGTLAATLAAHEDPVVPVRDVDPDVPAALEDVVMRCLARIPDFRPTAAELTRLLGRVVEPGAASDVGVHRHHSTSDVAVGVHSHHCATRRARRLAVAAVAGVAAVALGLAVALSSGGGSKPPPRPSAGARVGPPVLTGPPAARAHALAAWLRRTSR